MNNHYPSYPTILNLSLMKYSEDFYGHFADLIQTEDQLFPKTKNDLNEKKPICNKALNLAAEDNLKPRERIDRTLKMINIIKNKFDKKGRAE